MPGARHVNPVVTVGAPEASAHRLRPLVGRTHAAECSHGCGVAAHVCRHHGDTADQVRRSCGKQQGDGAPIAVTDDVNRLDTTLGEHRPEIGDILIEHRGGEPATVGRPAEPLPVVHDRPATTGTCGQESVPGPGGPDAVMKPHGCGVTPLMILDVHGWRPQSTVARTYQTATPMPPKVAIAAGNAA